MCSIESSLQLNKPLNPTQLNEMATPQQQPPQWTCVFIKAPTAKNPNPTTCGACTLGALNMCFTHVQATITQEMDALQKAVKVAGKAAKKAATKESSKNTKKDSNRVKKPSSPYIQFCNAMREQVKQEDPSLDNHAVMGRLGEMWNALKEDTAGRAPYDQLAEEDKARYERELSERVTSEEASSESETAVEEVVAAVEESVAEPEVETAVEELEVETAVKEPEVVKPVEKKITTRAKKAAGKKDTDPAKTKKPMTPYMCYCNATRDQLKIDRPEVDTHKKLVKVQGDLWKAMKNDEALRAPYAKLAEEDKARYERELAAPAAHAGPSGTELHMQVFGESDSDASDTEE